MVDSGANTSGYGLATQIQHIQNAMLQHAKGFVILKNTSRKENHKSRYCSNLLVIIFATQVT